MGCRNSVAPSKWLFGGRIVFLHFTGSIACGPRWNSGGLVEACVQSTTLLEPAPPDQSVSLRMPIGVLRRAVASAAHRATADGHDLLC